METISLIRRLKFFGFLKANGTFKHEDGRGYFLYIIARPEWRLKWNIEQGVLVVYDEEGNPWCRLMTALTSLIENFLSNFPETSYDRKIHVPHAFDQNWKWRHFHPKPCQAGYLIDNPIDLLLEKQTRDLHGDEQEIIMDILNRRQLPNKFSGPPSIEIVEAFESWAQKNGLSDQIGLSN